MQLSFSVHPFILVPEQRDKLPSNKWTSFGELSSPGGIIVDKDGFVYVTNFAGVGSYILYNITLYCMFISHHYYHHYMVWVSIFSYTDPEGGLEARLECHAHKAYTCEWLLHTAMLHCPFSHGNLRAGSTSKTVEAYMHACGTQPAYEVCKIFCGICKNITHLLLIETKVKWNIIKQINIFGA